MGHFVGSPHPPSSTYGSPSFTEFNTPERITLPKQIIRERDDSTHSTVPIPPAGSSPKAGEFISPVLPQLKISKINTSEVRQNLLSKLEKEERASLFDISAYPPTAPKETSPVANISRASEMKMEKLFMELEMLENVQKTASQLEELEKTRSLEKTKKNNELVEVALKNSQEKLEDIFCKMKDEITFRKKQQKTSEEMTKSQLSHLKEMGVEMVRALAETTSSTRDDFLEIHRTLLNKNEKEKEMHRKTEEKLQEALNKSLEIISKFEKREMEFEKEKNESQKMENLAKENVSILQGNVEMLERLKKELSTYSTEKEKEKEKESSEKYEDDFLSDVGGTPSSKSSKLKEVESSVPSPFLPIQSINEEISSISEGSLSDEISSDEGLEKLIPTLTDAGKEETEISFDLTEELGSDKKEEVVDEVASFKFDEGSASASDLFEDFQNLSPSQKKVFEGGENEDGQSTTSSLSSLAISPKGGVEKEKEKEKEKAGFQPEDAMGMSTRSVSESRSSEEGFEDLDSDVSSLHENIEGKASRSKDETISLATPSDSYGSSSFDDDQMEKEKEIKIKEFEARKESMSFEVMGASEREREKEKEKEKEKDKEMDSLATDILTKCVESVWEDMMELRSSKEKNPPRGKESYDEMLEKRRDDFKGNKIKVDRSDDFMANYANDVLKSAGELGWKTKESLEVDLAYFVQIETIKKNAESQAIFNALVFDTLNESLISFLSLRNRVFWNPPTNSMIIKEVCAKMRGFRCLSQSEEEKRRVLLEARTLVKTGEGNDNMFFATPSPNSPVDNMALKKLSDDIDAIVKSWIFQLDKEKSIIPFLELRKNQKLLCFDLSDALFKQCFNALISEISEIWERKV